mmetsp:Transcript_22156/g.33493  ORF Transcript_22156/g.33493 Transcript_22156/m.33493 type:complete len:396 (+) Transcript_22156:126-1313(+)
MIYSITIILLVSILLTSASLAADDTSAQESIVDWVRENGGHFSRKQEFRRAIPGDTTSHFGIFAKENIQKGELLTRVPWKCIITRKNMEEDKRNPYFFCGSTRMLIDEIKKGEESFFAPYTAYLKSQPRGKIPSDWSAPGKDLLNEVLGEDALPPDYATGLIDFWQHSCAYQGAQIGPLEQQALVEYHSRADDQFLIPLYDLYNHAQDEMSNGSIGVFKGDKQELRATRAISRGEEIAFSYNFATHQDSWTKKYYGTSEFLRDFGFVESFPQRWVFDEDSFRFDLKKDADGEIELTWLSEPDKEYFDFIREQLERLRFGVKPILEDIEKQVQNGLVAGKVPADLPLPAEMKTIRQYFDSLKSAMEAAIKSEHEVNPTDDDVNDDNDDDDDDNDEL